MNKAACLVLMVVSMTIVSCNNEDNFEKNVNNSLEYELKSNLSQEEFKGVITNLAQRVGNNTRTSDTAGEDLILDEEEIQNLLGSLIEDGTRLRNLIVENESFAESELDSIMSITSEQLAFLSFIINVQQIEEPSATRSSAQSCALSAILGLDTTGGLTVSGVKQLLKATTGKLALKAVAKYSLGYIGTAWVLYDYAECMGWT